MGLCKSKATPQPLSGMTKPRLRRRRSARPFGEELGSRVPEAVSYFLLYITFWAPPPRRVAGGSRWAKSRATKLKKLIMRDKFREEVLFGASQPRLSLDVAPEVAMLVVHDYLRHLPGHLLRDGASWHSLGHSLLVFGEEPWHHHMPYVFLTRIKALRGAITPTHNLLLDQVVCAMRTSGGGRPPDIFDAARFWAPVMVRPPTTSQCMSCAYKPAEVSSLGVAHALYYLARFGLAVHDFPFSDVIKWSASVGAEGDTEGGAPSVDLCDLCDEEHVVM